MNWRERFSFGRIAENKIARFLAARGNFILPAYEAETEDGDKTPRIFGEEQELIATDIFTFNPRAAAWVEAKRKTHASWHYRTKSWQCAIDQKYYEHYCEIARFSPLPVWLMFLIEQETPHPRDLHRGCPAQSPAGLFGADLVRDLMLHIDHYDPKWGLGGGVFWKMEQLKKLATLEQVNETLAGKKPIIEPPPDGVFA